MGELVIGDWLFVMTKQPITKQKADFDWYILFGIK